MHLMKNSQISLPILKMILKTNSVLENYTAVAIGFIVLPDVIIRALFLFHFIIIYLLLFNGAYYRKEALIRINPLCWASEK